MRLVYSEMAALDIEEMWLDILEKPGMSKSRINTEATCFQPSGKRSVSPNPGSRSFAKMVNSRVIMRCSLRNTARSIG